MLVVILLLLVFLVTYTVGMFIIAVPDRRDLRKWEQELEAKKNAQCAQRSRLTLPPHAPARWPTTNQRRVARPTPPRPPAPRRVYRNEPVVGWPCARTGYAEPQRIPATAGSQRMTNWRG